MKAEIFNNLSVSATSFEVFIAEEHGNNMQWKDDGKEFILNGEMYDVAKIEKVNGKTVLHCVNDKKEKELLSNFIKAIKAGAHNGKSGKHSLKFQLTDYTITPIDKSAEFRLLPDQKFVNYTSSLYTAVSEITTPPPRA
jgi:hypothetical protein